jgi:hypothetical protein
MVSLTESAIALCVPRHRWGMLDAVQGIHYPIPAEEDIMGRYFTLGIMGRL